MDRYFWHLSQAQASGMACVVCGGDLMATKTAFVPVGLEPATHTKVYACREPCAVSVAVSAERMAAELRLLAGVSEQQEAVQLGQDGEFGALLRDLRILVGTEALLAVTTDIPTLLFLLHLTEHHGGIAAARARLIYDRLCGTESGAGED